MLGSILSNLLLVLGCAFLAGEQGSFLAYLNGCLLRMQGGVVYPESEFQVTAAQTYVTSHLYV